MPARRLSWDQLVEIAHRKFHLHAARHGARAAGQIRLAGADRRRACRRRTAASRCIPATPSSATSCWWRSIPRPASRRSTATSCGHDCGVMINPDIVHGMTYGGIAHGIGAALLREIRLRRRRPAASRHLHGLPDSVRAGGAGDRDRRPLHALAADRVRPEGLGRGRLSRRAGRDRQRHQRRARAARRVRSTRCRSRIDALAMSSEPHSSDAS